MKNRLGWFFIGSIITLVGIFTVIFGNTDLGMVIIIIGIILGYYSLVRLRKSKKSGSK